MTTNLRTQPHIFAIGLVSLVLTACNAATPSATPTPTSMPSASPVESPSAESTSTPVPSPSPIGWQAGGSMVMRRLGERAALLKDGTILVVGNETCLAAGEPTGSERAELYDPATGTWSGVGSLNKPRQTPALVALRDGRAMVLGGTNPDSQPYSSTKLYAPATRAFSDGPLMTRAGATHAITMANGDVLAVGRDRAELLPQGSTTWRRIKTPSMSAFVEGLVVTGRGALLTGDAADGSGPLMQLFDAEHGTWTAMEPPAVLRPQLVALTDGSILAIGDDEGGSHVQRLAAGASAWVDTAQMAVGRIRPQVTTLPDGRVLVAGGAELKVETVEGGTAVQIGGPLASVEIYDPIADTWTVGPALLGPRQDGHAISLTDGSVLVFGGYAETPAQPIDPDTGTPGPCPEPLATTERLQSAS